MLKYIVKRILLSVLILMGVSIIIYTLVRLMPGNYIEDKLAAQSMYPPSPEDVYRLKRMYGIHDDSFWGIISGYFNWLSNLLSGQLGESFVYKKPVNVVIGENMWISFMIAGVALVLEFLIAIPLGITSAAHQYSKRDYAVTIFTMMGISLPSFFLSTLMIKVFAVEFGWFPVQGAANPHIIDPNPLLFFVDNLYHLILPMLVFVILSIGSLMRYTRTNMLEVLNADYIRTARAKGLSEGAVIYRHAFRNTMIPLVTMLAGILPGLFGGAMIIEEAFAIPGIGKLAYDALRQGDVPFIMGYNMFLAVLAVVGTLLSDIMYMVVDPRVKLG